MCTVILLRISIHLLRIPTQRKLPLYSRLTVPTVVFPICQRHSHQLRRLQLSFRPPQTHNQRRHQPMRRLPQPHPHRMPRYLKRLHDQHQLPTNEITRRIAVPINQRQTRPRKRRTRSVDETRQQSIPSWNLRSSKSKKTSMRKLPGKSHNLPSSGPKTSRPFCRRQRRPPA